MLKNRRWYVAGGFVLACVLINFAGKLLSERLGLPMWLDSLGTIASAYAFGPVCAAVVGLSVNVIYGLLYAKVYMVYGLVSAAIGVIAGVCAKRRWFDTMFGALSTGFIIALVSVVISVPCNYLFFDGRVTNEWGNGVITLLESIGANRLMSHVIGEFYVDFLDKVLICVVVFLVVRLAGVIFGKGSYERAGVYHVAKKTVFVIAAVLLLSLICAAFIGYATNIKGEEGHTLQNTDTDSGSLSSDCEDGSSLNFDSCVRTVFDSSNGLVGGTANTIEKTSDGILWIGTYGGLYRYNGTQFKLMENLKSVKNVNCLYTDESDRLWIGTNDNGLSILSGGEITDVLDETDGLGADSVRCIARASSGDYYVGTTGSLSVVAHDGDACVKTLIDDIVYATDISTDAFGNVAVVTDDGTLYIVRDGSVVDTYAADDSTGYESCLYTDDGLLYTGTSDGDVYVYEAEGDKMKLIKHIQCGGLSNIQSITSEGEVLYLCADNGAGYIDVYGVYHRINTGEFNRSFENMLIDYQGNYWFTSSRLGLLCMCPSVFTDINSEFGTKEDVVNTTAYWNGLLYEGLDEGLAVIDLTGRGGGNPELAYELSGVRIRDIKADSSGNLWIATSGMGIYKVNEENEITVFGAEQNTNGVKFRSIIELSDGDIMASGDSGITCIRDDRVVYTAGYEDGLENPKILCMLESFSDDEEFVFAGSDGAGIYKLKDGEIVGHYGKDDGLCSNVVLRMVRLRDDRGILIVTSNGLCYMDENERIVSIDDFPYYNNYDIVEREDGMLFVLGSAGIYVVDGEKLISGEDLTYTLLNSKTGLDKSLTPNSWNYMDDKGNLYLSTDSGVVMMNLNHYDTSARSYRTYVSSVIIDGVEEPVYSGSPIRLARGAARIEIIPEIVNYSPNDPYVSIWLEGFDDEPKLMRLSEMSEIVYTI